MHIGRKITKLRELKGIKQEDLARLLNVTQQAISKIESKSEIDDEVLKQIADKLGFTVEGIKEFNPDAMIQSINQHCGNVNVAETLHINPIEKIVELYDKIIRDKDAEIAELKKQLASNRH